MKRHESPHQKIEVVATGEQYPEFPRKGRILAAFERRHEPDGASALLALIENERSKHPCLFLGSLLGTLVEPKELPFLLAAIHAPSRILRDQALYDLTRRDFCRQQQGQPTPFSGTEFAPLRRNLARLAIGLDKGSNLISEGAGDTTALMALKFLDRNTGPEVEEQVQAYLPQANLLTQGANIRALSILLALLSSEEGPLQEETVRLTSLLALDPFQSHEVRDYAYTVLDVALSRESSNLSLTLQSQLVETLCSLVGPTDFSASIDRRELALDAFLLLGHFSPTDDTATQHRQRLFDALDSPSLKRALSFVLEPHAATEQEILDFFQQPHDESGYADAFILIRRRLPAPLQERVLRAFTRWLETHEEALASETCLSDTRILSWALAATHFARRYQIELGNQDLDAFMSDYGGPGQTSLFRFRLMTAGVFCDLRVPPPPFFYRQLVHIGSLVNALEHVRATEAENGNHPLKSLADVCVQRLFVDGPACYGVEFTLARQAQEPPEPGPENG